MRSPLESDKVIVLMGLALYFVRDWFQWVMNRVRRFLAGEHDGRPSAPREFGNIHISLGAVRFLPVANLE